MLSHRGFRVVRPGETRQIRNMKILARLVMFVALACSFTACLLKEPVFSEGFAKTDSALGGVWAQEGDEGDPRKTEFAMCAPLDEGSYVLHYPTSEKGGIYFEAKPVVIRDRTVLQLRALATLRDGIAPAGSERYTLVWIEKEADGQKVRIRAIRGESVKGKSPADIRKALETESTDWGKLFGEAAVFQRLKDR